MFDIANKISHQNFNTFVLNLEGTFQPWTEIIYHTSDLYINLVGVANK